MPVLGRVTRCLLAEQVQRVHLYQVHVLDPNTDLEETISTLSGWSAQAGLELTHMGIAFAISHPAQADPGRDSRCEACPGGRASLTGVPRGHLQAHRHPPKHLTAS